MSKSKLIRIGNDIVVRWTVKTNGADASLEDKDIAVRLTDVLGGNCNITWSVDGNVVTVSYPGKFQKKLGKYTLVLIDTTGGGMKTVDVCKAFELVPYSFLAGGSDASNIETEVVELTSSIEYGTFIEIDETLSVKGMAADAKKTGEELAKKVEKVTGKGLSTNDYTNAEKQKLASALTDHQDITGKADVFVIRLTESGIDKTFAQIKEAVAAGKVIIGDYYGQTKLQLIPSIDMRVNNQAVVFAYARSGGRMMGTFIINSNGRAEIYDCGVDITGRTTPTTIDKLGSYLPWSDSYVCGDATAGLYVCSSLLVNTDYGKKYILWYEFDGVCPKKVFSYDIRSWGAHWPEQIDSNVVLYCDEVYESSDSANWPTWLRKVFALDVRDKIEEYEQRISALESN